MQGGRTRERRVPQDGSEKKRYFSYGCRISPPASISSGRHRPAGVHAKQLNFFLEKQPALAALVREWKSRPQAPVPVGAAEPYVESGFERIEQLDPRIQARIRAAAEASTASRKFG